jgi:hypothetical protein
MSPRAALARATKGEVMTRLVSAKAVTSNAGQPLEDYLERVAKYVPVEIIAAYLAIRGFLPEHGTDGAVPAWVEIAIYASLIVLTPLYLLRVARDVPDKRRQIAIAMVSFAVWSYAIGGPFFWAAVSSLASERFVYPGLAGALVVIWSLAAGLARPRPPGA